MLFLCIAEKDHPQKACFHFLRELRIALKEAYPEMDYVSLVSCQARFAPIVSQKMLYYSSGSQIGEIQEKVADIRTILLDNIDKVFKRGDTLADIEAKAADLNEETPVFAKAAKNTRKRKWRENKRLTLLLGAIIYCICCMGCCALMYFILAMACGGLALNNCVDSVFRKRY